ncbi:hypothetical protein EMIHUDRAFT_206339 [Emiliania huxleyi CCMP1516]|uniref:RING-type domain-containing protein n=2 Tax=Emiliania huxleyi TaxID=2903 RepID=A0A0D3JNU7_EMIH1|nr:hypothetical protein EMIHUDRAFT_206339 [Emiliania huxleyi CCMP1516]EOD25182.1 hypothetical protein EMIHUDRAFT_206339 [Emiliania huxleyi CCMP1516]|eukprot:XP_005777611.1 hypothetical protein EMIHUDRAFT_206339 [Emiliania huxleyi CCMP1516]
MQVDEGGAMEVDEARPATAVKGAATSRRLRPPGGSDEERRPGESSLVRPPAPRLDPQSAASARCPPLYSLRAAEGVIGEGDAVRPEDHQRAEAWREAVRDATEAAEEAGRRSRAQVRAYVEAHKADMERVLNERLRFRPGKRVYCNRSARPGFNRQHPPHPTALWEEGRVTQVWPANLEAGGAPYQVILKDGTYLFVKEDTDECIRDDKRDDAGWLEACYSHWPAPECARTQRLLNGVLTAEEVHALLSRSGLELLHDIDTVFEEVDPFRERDTDLTLLLPETIQPYHVLRNFVVWRRAAVPVCADEPLYSPALIRDVYPDPSSDASGTLRWLLDLVVSVDGVVRYEQAVPPWRLSNAVGGSDRESRDVVDTRGGCLIPDAREALAGGEGAARLSFLLAEASSGVAAIDKWHELLRTADLYEYEPAAGEDTLVGEYSYHAAFYASLRNAQSALLDFLAEITNPKMEEENSATWQRWLVELYDAWPPDRRKIAVAWLRWLLGPEERQHGFTALREFVVHESGLPPDEHIARDDAGRFSLPRAARDALVGPVGELVSEGVVERLHDPERLACPLCHREGGSCSEWVQLYPCRHWCCQPCVADWERVEGDAAAAVCPVCRTIVEGTDVSELDWEAL